MTDSALQPRPRRRNSATLGNLKTSRVVKCGWARSDGDRYAEWVARFLAACEDAIGVSRRPRRPSREFFRSY